MAMQALPPNFVRRRACRTSCIATARTCVHHLPGNLLTAIRRILFFVMERRSTPFARQPMPQLFLHVYPWRPPTALLSAPTAAACLACVLYSFATHLARTLAFPGCSLSVSPHPVLMGAFPVSRGHASGDSRVHLVANVLHLLTSCLGAQLGVKPPAFVVIPIPPFPQAEQFLLIVIHAFHPFHLARDMFLFCRFS